MTTTAERIALTRTLEDHSEVLVEMADEALSDNVMGKLRRARHFMNQLNNLANVAREASGPAVVENWVRYQMGRRETQRTWGDDTGFGKNVLQGLHEIHELVDGLDLENRGAQREAEMTMIRRYTGYLVRWFVAKGGQE